MVINNICYDEIDAMLRSLHNRFLYNKKLRLREKRIVEDIHRILDKIYEHNRYQICNQPEKHADEQIMELCQKIVVQLRALKAEIGGDYIAELRDLQRLQWYSYQRWLTINDGKKAA